MFILKYGSNQLYGGHDDAFAIILGGHNPNIRLLGISTTAGLCEFFSTPQLILGNQTIEKTTINALNVTSVSGLEHISYFLLCLIAYL
jgi:inosine-uridine nucleoside N-ribohydrolase